MNKLGDRMFEVEWCSDLPVNEFGDCEPDLATYVIERFATIDEARMCAADRVKDDVWGVVTVTEVELSDPFGDKIPRTYIWEEISDPEYIDA